MRVSWLIVLSVFCMCGAVPCSTWSTPSLPEELAACVEQLPHTWRRAFRRQRARSQVMPKRVRRVWQRCAQLQIQHDDVQSIAQFTAELLALPPAQLLDKDSQRRRAEEASLIASHMIRTTRQQALVYQMAGSALWHNALIKLGKKSGGYCYHWTRDLVQALQDALPLTYYRVEWGVASPGKVTENNALLLSSRHGSLDRALVYDAWRGRGNPFWRDAASDSYDWEVRFTEKNLMMGLADTIR